MFHTQCVSKWVLNEKKCPTCQKEMPKEVLDHAREVVGKIPAQDSNISKKNN